MTKNTGKTNTDEGGATQDVLATFANMLMRRIEESGGTIDHVKRIMSPESDVFMQQIVNVVLGESAQIGQMIPVTVDYGLSIDEMVRAGKYDWSSSDVTNASFPLRGSGKERRNLIMLSFKKSVRTAEVHLEMKRLGLRPGAVEELLTLAMEQPELQHEMFIAALGSTWLDPGLNRRVPVLGTPGGRRDLSLGWGDRDDEWLPTYRFIAVRV